MTYPAGTKLRQRTPTVQLVGQDRPVWTTQGMMPDGTALLVCGRIQQYVPADELDRDWEPAPEPPPLTDAALADLEANATDYGATVMVPADTLSRLVTEIRRLRALPTVAKSTADALSSETERQGGQKVAEAVTSHVQRKP